MKKNNGFTLVELLVVIAIIAMLSVLVIPNIIGVNSNIKERNYEQLQKSIISAAELYGTNNPDIFKGSDTVQVPVWKLIENDYLTADTTNCPGDTSTYHNDKGCIIDPRDTTPDDKVNMNNLYVTLVKKNVGVVGTFSDEGGTIVDSSVDTLVSKVCQGFGTNYNGVDANGNACECNNKNNPTSIVLSSNKTTQASKYCVLVSNKNNGEVNNYLKYGSSEANWRVIGIYDLGQIEGSGQTGLSAKMITRTTIEE